MAYDEKLADRVREALMDLDNVEEKKMFSGVCFLVNDKMCVCVGKEELLCRIGQNECEIALEQNCCRQMIMKDKIAKDYIYVNDEGMRTQKEFMHWINLCLAFNKEAKASKKKSK